MKPSPQDSAQTMQRLRVGLTGLALVIILIGLASAIFKSVNRDEPVAAIGAPNAETVANMTGDRVGNVLVEKTTNEPLAELGVAPSSSAPANAAAAMPETPVDAPLPVEAQGQGQGQGQGAGQGQGVGQGQSPAPNSGN